MRVDKGFNEENLYDMLAKASNVDRNEVKKVLYAFSYTQFGDKEQLKLMHLERIAIAIEQLEMTIRGKHGNI